MAPVQRVVLAELLSGTGSSLTQFAVPVAVLASSGSPGYAGLVASLLTLGVVIAPFGAPRILSWLGCRRSMIVADALSCAVSLLMAVSIATAGVAVWMLAVAAVVLGFLSNSFNSGEQLILAEMASGDELTAAYGKVMAASRLAAIGGPMAAGAVLSGPGLWLLFALDAASYLVSLIIMSSVTREVSPPPSESSAVGFMHSVRWIWASRLARSWTGAAAVTEFGWQLLFLGLPVIAIDRWNSPVVAGVLFACFSGGSLVGSLLVGPVVRRFGRVHVASIARLLVVIVFLLVTIANAYVAPLAALIAASGLVNGIANPGIASILLEAIPAPQRGAVTSARYSLNMAGGLAGRAGGGGIYQVLPIAVSLAIATVVQGVGWLMFAYGAKDRTASSAPRAQEVGGASELRSG